MTETRVITIRAMNGDQLFEWLPPSDRKSSIVDVKRCGEALMGIPTCFLEFVFKDNMLTDDVPIHILPLSCQLTLIVTFKLLFTVSAACRFSYLHVASRLDNDRQINFLVCVLQTESANCAEYQPLVEDEEDVLAPLLEETIARLTEIARDGDTLVLDAIFPFTDHRCAEVRVAALNALATKSCRGDTRVIREAVRRLRDGGHSHSDRLCNSRHHRHHVREAAAGVLLDVASIGDQDVLDALIMASRVESNRFVRQGVVIALKHLATKDNTAVLTALLDCLNDVCMGVRGAAMDAIPYFSTHVQCEVISVLAAAGVNENQKNMRHKALAALIKLSVSGHDGAMAIVVSHSRPCVRRAAIAMLPEWRDTSTEEYSHRLITALRYGLTDSNSRVMRTAIVSTAALVHMSAEHLPLSSIGRSVAEMLSEHLQHFSMATLHHAWVDLLVTYMQHKAHHIRESAAKALGGYPPNDEYTLARLEECLQHQRGNVRRAALDALSRVAWVHPQSRRVHDLLTRQTSDPDFWVARAANATLKSLLAGSAQHELVRE